jgi:tRNA dimethylallyltransferase
VSPSLALVGATASGKTALSVPLARWLDAEIISLDSRQVYRGMDIGTDKIDVETQALIPHHGIDLIDPDERYSAGRFARDARRWMAEIRARGRFPFLVGGTGFFLRALMEPIFTEPRMDPARRDALRAALETLPHDTWVRWVRRLDPARAEVAEAGGRQRLLRTLEVALLTGCPLSWHHANAAPEAPAERLAVVWLRIPRAELDRRIAARVTAMFDRGLLAEVDRLLRAGVSVAAPGMTGTGYREAAAVLTGKLTLEEGMERVVVATRQYARRQETWFRHQLPETGVLHLDGLLEVEAQFEAVRTWWTAHQEEDTR